MRKYLSALPLAAVVIACVPSVALGANPTVTSIEPTSGPAVGGTSVKIKGTGFVSPATVKIGSEATEVNVVTAEEITAKTPAGSGAPEVTVTDEGGSSTGGPHYTYIAPPTVVTKAATSITQTSATLEGTVNPNGGEVSECKFEYGTTEAYGLSAMCSLPPGSGTSPVPVSASATTLIANTTYHFRVVAKNVGGTSNGADQTFKTPAEPVPLVVTNTASSVTQTGATLNASVNPNGSEVSECKFEYGTITAYGKTATCNPAPGSASSPVAVSAAITSLAPNTTYHFRISATNAGGPSRGADAEFNTLADPVPPSLPPGPPPPIVQVKPVVIPNSSFKVLGATLSLATYAITFTESVADPGTFSWVFTFENGKFGVFAATAKKCKAGSIRLKGRCRPAKVLFARGSETVANAGNVTFTVRPTRAGMKALKKAFKQKKGLPVTALVTFQSSHGGAPNARVQSLIVKGRR